MVGFLININEFAANYIPKCKENDFVHFLIAKPNCSRASRV